MRDGMAGKVGIGKLALYGREYLVAVKPQGRGIVMYTLHHAAEIRSIEQVEDLNSVPTSVKPEEMKLAHRSSPPSRDHSTSRATQTSIAPACSASSTRRSPARKCVAPADEAPPKVVNLMEALRKSLDSVERGEEEAGQGSPRVPVAKAVAPRRKRA